MRHKNSTLYRAEALTLGTFFCLYVAQSIPSSSLSTALQVMMREQQFSLSSIGLLQLVKLPWILKFLWAPLVDRHCLTVRDYKRCIIVSEVIYAGLLCAIGLLQVSSDIYLILGLIILALIASGTQDIATDSLAALNYGGRDKSLVNTMQSSGSFAGTLVGSGLLLVVLYRYGWQVVLLCLALFVLLALVPLGLERQITFEKKDPKRRAGIGDFALFFSRKGIWRQVLFLLLFYSGLMAILPMLRPWLVDQGFDMGSIGVLSGLLGTGTAFVSSLASGLVVRRIGIYRARKYFATLILVATLYFLILTQVEVSTLLVSIGVMLLWAAYGSATVVVYVSSMETLRAGREGTDFTVQIVITHLCGMGMAILGGVVADHTGYSGLFALAVLLALISLIYIHLVFKNEK